MNRIAIKASRRLSPLRALRSFLSRNKMKGEQLLCLERLHYIELVGFLSIISLSDLSAQSPAAATPLPSLAAPSPSLIYYLTQPVWVRIQDKSYGFGTGTQFELLQNSGNRVRVRNGNYEFEIDRALVTNDYAAAKQAYDAEIAKIAQQGQEKAREQEEAAQATKRTEEREAAARTRAAQTGSSNSAGMSGTSAATSVPAAESQELASIRAEAEIRAAEGRGDHYGAELARTQAYYIPRIGAARASGDTKLANELTEQAKEEIARNLGRQLLSR